MNNLKYKILSKSHMVYSTILFIILLIKFIKHLFNKNKELAFSNISKIEYDNYGNREILDHENNSWVCILNNKQVFTKYKTVRNEYLNIIFKYIDELLNKKETIKILEIGCWNWINSMIIKEKYWAKVKILASDISFERINQWKKYYWNKMENIDFKQINIVTDDIEWNENLYDLVFSIHVLEQIPYEWKDAIVNMVKSSNDLVVLIEPDWYLANPLQRLYLIENDHIRCIKDIINLLWYNLSEYYKSSVQSCIYNPSIVFKIKK